jgi:hypothetical protein
MITLKYRWSESNWFGLQNRLNTLLFINPLCPPQGLMGVPQFKCYNLFKIRNRPHIRTRYPNGAWQINTSS